ncbi:MAG: asparagine synthase (glutamine-hydrolyzing) [Pseudomonadota bacterium]
MCGIVGIVEPARHRYGLADVRAMANEIVHRGPDGGGFFDGGEALLGMRRLSIIDLAGGNQPIANADKTVWVVNNGEIYNFRQLRTELESLGYRFRTASDTEVLVHSYDAWGEEFLDRIDGMFALALWDTKRRKLVLARDRLGIKPLYYWQFPGGFGFASEIKAFRPLAGFSAALDRNSLLDYLGLGYAVAPATAFEGVRKLPPGHCLIWEGGAEPTIRSYWALPTETDESLSYADWVERVAEELRRSVADHLVADVPVGAFLSGGIDSSAICALMKEANDNALSTYSIGYAGSRVADYYNELPYARIVADQLGSQHREIAVQPNVAELLPKLLWHLEEPISDSAITTTFLVSELAAESVKVIMSGVGGDELFAGYNRYLGDHYIKRYRRVPGVLRKSLLPSLARLLPSGRQNRLMDLARYAKRFVQADQLGWRERYAYFLAIADEDMLGALLNGDIAGSNGLQRIAALESSDDDLLRLMRIDWQTQLSEMLLLLTDKLTMACSIECRVPFLDTRLSELAARIPTRHKLPNGRLKGVLKDALRGILPDDVIDRRKRGFGAPVGAWFKSELARLRSHLLSRQTISRRGFLDPDAVTIVCRDHDASRADYTDLLLVLMNLEVWSQLYLDGRSVEDVSGELSDIHRAA